MKNIDESVAYLRQSPLYKLSLSSRELFHSNFVAWGIENLPEIFLGALGMVGDGEIQVFREKDDFDLTVSMGEKWTVIENKLKSLPSAKQLSEYKKKAETKYSDVNFILLSPVPLRASDLHEWRHVTYGDFGGGLKKHLREAKTNKYFSELVEDYANVCAHVQSLANCTQDLAKKSVFAYLARFEGDEFDGFRDAIGKWVLNGVAGEIRKMLINHCVLDDFSSLKSVGADGDFSVSVGFTRGTPIVDLKVKRTKKNGDAIFLGVQVQGRQFRVFVEGKENVEREAIQLEKSTDFFQICGVSGDAPNTRVKDFNRYGPGFLYRYTKLKEISAKRLAEGMVVQALHASSAFDKSNL